MDDLKDSWDRLSTVSENTSTPTPEEIRSSMTKSSIGTLDSLTKQVYFKFVFCGVFAVFFLAVLPFVAPAASQILLTILAVAYTVGTFLVYKEYKFIKSKTFLDTDLLTGLKTCRHRVQKTQYFEELIALCLYPVSAAAGWFLGFRAFGNQSEMDDITWIVFVVALILLTVLGHFLSKWMTRRTFGKLIDQLDENIRELESMESETE